MHLAAVFHSVHLLGSLWGDPTSARACPASPAVAPRAAFEAGAAAGALTAFVDVHVLPMDTERVLRHQTVLVEGGRITALGPSNQVQVPAGAMRIEGRDQYLIPGLADMHAHLLLRARDSVTVECRLLESLASGVTTIRNMEYLPVPRRGPMRLLMPLEAELALRFRTRAAARDLLSPRIYTSAPWGPPQYITADSKFGGGAMPRLDSVQAYVAAYKAAGYDFLKIHDERAVVVESLLVIAPRLGMPLVGHVRTSIGIDRTLALGGYTSIEHLRGYVRSPLSADSAAAFDDARIQMLVAITRRSGVWNCPTLSIHEGGKVTAAELAIHRRLVKAMQDAGAGLLLGTDALPGRDISVHQELAALVRAGLTPYQALLTGTRNVAMYFGTLGETGTIAVGKRADLVLLPGNPLADISQTAHPAGVMLGGRWLSRAELDRLLEGTP